MASARYEEEFESVPKTLMQDQPGGLVVANDPGFASRRHRLVTLVARFGIPAIYAQREYAEAGGLASYGTNFADVYRQLASTQAAS